MRQHLDGEIASLGTCQVFVHEIEHGFIHADQPDGREMVVPMAQIPLRIGKKSLVHELGYDLALDFEGIPRDAHEVVDLAEIIFF